MRSRKEENKITLIISLILHAIFLFIFTFYGFQKRPEFKISKLAQKKIEERLKKSRMQSQLLPKASAHGTEFVFDNRDVLPEEEKEIKKIKKIKKVKKLEVKKQEIKKEEVKKLEQKKLLEKKLAQAKFPELIKPAIAKKVPVKTQEIKKVKEEKKPVKKLETKKEVKKIEKKKKSLLSLMKTFLDHDQGNSCLIREGSNKFPGLDEMKYICYEKKIENSILDTWRDLYSRTRYQTNSNVSFTYLIKKDGTVIQAKILESSGDRRFDEAVLECVQKTTFPPVPDHFGVETYRPRGGLTVLPAY